MCVGVDKYCLENKNLNVVYANIPVRSEEKTSSIRVSTIEWIIFT